MQLIAEVYGLLRDGAGWDAPRIGVLLERWQEGPLSSYLIEISAAALQHLDPDTGAPMVDVIVDRAGQKGTGRWTVIEALKMGQSANTIEAAIGARGWSSEKPVREVAEGVLEAGAQDFAMPETLIWRLPFWRRVLSPMLRASAFWRRHRMSLIGRMKWRASVRSGARAASSVQRCWMILRQLSARRCRWGIWCCRHGLQSA